MPVVELTGAQDGPLLTVIAGVHGCEYVPMAAVRRWTRNLEQREFSGRVRAVPILNVTAFRARSPFVVPEDGKNLNRCFPGNPDGTLAERLAYAAFTELITGSDAVIDAHCGDMVEALEPFALYEAGAAEATAREMALAYGLGYVIRQERGPDRAVGGTSSGAAAEAGIPAITAEVGGCGLVEAWAVDTHERGLNAVLTQLGMTTGGEITGSRAGAAGPVPVAALRSGGLLGRRGVGGREGQRGPGGRHGEQPGRVAAVRDDHRPGRRRDHLPDHVARGGRRRPAAGPGRGLAFSAGPFS